ncbi:hypothetical protein, partial [Morganella morganii]|uniref:hypothetical protein n=1 Tax=Morganella morganii TaxID=582 RepID=UPI001C70BDB5
KKKKNITKKNKNNKKRKKKKNKNTKKRNKKKKSKFRQAEKKKKIVRARRVYAPAVQSVSDRPPAR